MDTIDSFISEDINNIFKILALFFPAKSTFFLSYFCSFISPFFSHFKVFLWSLVIFGCLLMIYSEGLKMALSLWELRNLTLSSTPEWCGWIVFCGTPDVIFFRFFPQVRSASQRNTYKAPILDKGVTADATVGGAGRRLVVSLLRAGGS